MIPYPHRKGHGRAIRLIRKRLGMTQEDLAMVLKVNKSQVAQGERDAEAMVEPMMLAYGGLARRVGLHSIARVFEAA